MLSELFQNSKSLVHTYTPWPINGIFRVNILLGTNLDFVVLQKQSILQYTPYYDIRRPVCIWSIILSKATF